MKNNLKHSLDVFVQWEGWKAMGSLFAKAWKAFISWSGWKRIITWNGWKKCFGLPFPLVALMSAASAAGLIMVFIHGLEVWVPAYFLYALSAWCLVALCVRLPGAYGSAKQWLAQHPMLAGLLNNQELHFKVQLYFQQLINFAYGTFKILSGVVVGSAWIGCDGIYNMAQAMIQLFQILGRKKLGTMVQQWRSYRFCGVLILLMHLTLTGIVFQMVNWNRVEEQGEIMLIATAAFAFYKFVSSFVEIAKDRKHKHPVDSSVRMLELSQAIFAIFSLQAGMLHTFGSGESWEHWCNLAVGCAVCMLTAAMGIYMIHRGSREIRKLQEKEYG